MHPTNLQNQPWWPCVEPLYRAGATADQLGALFKCSAMSIMRQMRAIGLRKGPGRPLKNAVSTRLLPATGQCLHLYEVTVGFLEPWPGRSDFLVLSLVVEGLPQLARMFDPIPSDLQITALYLNREVSP